MKNKKAWELTEAEFEAKRIPYKDKVGVYKSLNGLYTIEFKSNKNNGSAGLAHCFNFWVNGKKHTAPFVYAQKLMFELPEDFDYFVVWGLVIQYAKENNLLASNSIQEAINNNGAYNHNG